MKKYKGDLSPLAFLKAMNENVLNKGDIGIFCGNCPHPNGECIEWAKAGTCKLYGYTARHIKV